MGKLSRFFTKLFKPSRRNAPRRRTSTQQRGRQAANARAYTRETERMTLLVPQGHPLSMLAGQLFRGTRVQVDERYYSGRQQWPSRPPRDDDNDGNDIENGKKRASTETWASHGVRGDMERMVKRSLDPNDAGAGLGLVYGLLAHSGISDMVQDDGLSDYSIEDNRAHVKLDKEPVVITVVRYKNGDQYYNHKQPGQSQPRQEGSYNVVKSAPEGTSTSLNTAAGHNRPTEDPTARRATTDAVDTMGQRNDKDLVILATRLSFMTQYPFFHTTMSLMCRHNASDGLTVFSDRVLWYKLNKEMQTIWFRGEWDLEHEPHLVYRAMVEWQARLKAKYRQEETKHRRHT